MQQQDQRPPLGLKAGLQHVYPQTIDVGEEAGTNVWRKRSTLQGLQIGHARLLAINRPPSLAETAENESAPEDLGSRRPRRW